MSKLRFACTTLFLILSVWNFPAVANKSAHNQCTETRHSPRVALVVPTSNENSFFDRMVEITQQASTQMGVDLRIHRYDEEQHNRFQYAKYIDQLLKEENDNDYILALYFSNTEEKVINVINNHKVHYLSFNSPFSKGLQLAIGKPREKTPYWIGHMAPDDVQAGYDLADKLINSKPNKPLSMLAINGSRNSEVGKMRATGLLNRVAESDQINLLQLLYTDWTYQQTREKAALLIKRYQNIDLIWSASDTLARAVIDELQQSKPQLLDNVIISSIDWSPQIVPLLKSNQVSQSFGGHIFEGAWLLALIYDHFNGNDFANELGTTISYKMKPIGPDNATLLERDSDNKMNFSALSKCLTPSTERYSFEPLNLLMSK